MGRILSNGVDYSGLNLITPECYSTEERVIGCWVNGKPLYAKTYVGGAIPASSNLDIPIDATNVDEIFISKAVAYSSTTGFSLSLNDVIPTNSQHSKRVYISKSNSKIVIDNGDSDGGMYDKSYVTVIYTKTTDSAGSGVWSPNAVPSVHYSTEEHVVGTWIDGSPLYEKTWELENAITLTSNTWTAIPPISKSIFSKIINCEVINSLGGTIGFIQSAFDSAQSDYLRLINVRNAEVNVKYVTLRYTKSS